MSLNAPIFLVSEPASRGASPLTTGVGVLPQNLSCLPLLANEMALKNPSLYPDPCGERACLARGKPVHHMGWGVATEPELTPAFLKRNGAGNPSLCPDPCGERAGLARGKPAHHRGWCVATEPELTAASLKRNGAGNPSLCPYPCGERAGLARGKPAHHRGWGVAAERELTAAFLKRNGAGNPSLWPDPCGERACLARRQFARRKAGRNDNNLTDDYRGLHRWSLRPWFVVFFFYPED